jgi:hypothetical protein
MAFCALINCPRHGFGGLGRSGAGFGEQRRGGASVVATQSADGLQNLLAGAAPWERLIARRFARTGALPRCRLDLPGLRRAPAEKLGSGRASRGRPPPQSREKTF